MQSPDRTIQVIVNAATVSISFQLSPTLLQSACFSCFAVFAHVIIRPMAVCPELASPARL